MGPWRRIAGWNRRTASGSISPPYAPPAAEVTDSRPKLSICFAGGAYGWPYYCGVAWFIQKHRLLRDDARLYGCSAGNVGGLYLAAGIDAEKDGLEICMQANESHLHPLLGPWLRPGKAIRAYYEEFGAKLLPPDAYVRASGRLHVLVTQLLPYLRRKIISQFPCNRALLDAIAASMAIPGHGVRFVFNAPAHDLNWCLDGGILGTLKDDDREGWQTVRVSILPTVNVPPLKRVHIAPARRLSFRQVFTVRSRQERRALHADGYEDAGRYFDRLLSAPAGDGDGAHLLRVAAGEQRR